MAGEAVLAYVSDQMFAVQLRESAAKTATTLSFAASVKDFKERLQQVQPFLVILDLTAAGAELESLIKDSKANNTKVIAFGPRAQEDVLNKAKEFGCDAVYTNSTFKPYPDEVLKMWLSSAN